MSHRERMARKRAVEVLAELGIPDPPVDPFAIARRKELRVEEVDFPTNGIFGALILEDGAFRVLVSRKCFGSGHRRFTVAHELGHYHIEGHLNELIAAGSGIKPSLGGHFRNQRAPEEREADWFASELLVPTAYGTSWVSSRQPTAESLQELADTFGVSLTCAGIRFAELTPAAVAVVLALDGGIEWVAMSDRVRGHRWARKYWKQENAPSHSVTVGLAQSPENVRQGERRDGSALLCEWFEGAPPDLEVEEEVLGLGRYGRTLTLLNIPDLPDPEDFEEAEQEHEESGTGDWRDALRGFRMG